jgi:aspartyl-tRNA(Asn)/glutamyl-tRNA(Gln) amidotransferase subunit C
MASTLTRADVERIAALAHLELTEEERTLFARQLADILAYAERLQQVDTSNVAAAWRLDAAAPPPREDVIRPSLDRADALANAADHSDGLFRVPKVIGS